MRRGPRRVGFTRLDPADEPEPDQSVRWASCATLIQSKFRRHRVVFGDLGPTLFSRKGGGEADYGELFFPKQGEAGKFITVSDSTSTMLLANFMERYWKLSRPEVLISVTGGAQDFVLSSRLQRVFDRGLVSAASSTNAWVVTGGTDTGVMKLVGTAFHQYGLSVPLIAFTPHGCVKGRKAFDGARKGFQTYNCDEKAAHDGAPLNPHHTHFVLVDSGLQGAPAWGTEIR